MRAPADAARHWRMLRELTADLPDTEKNREWANIARLQVLHDGWRQGEVSVQEAEKLFIEGREAAQSDGRTDFVALLTLAYGNVIGMAGRIDEWLRYANEAHALVRDIGSSDLEVMTLTGLVPAADACGDSRTLELLERGIELTGRDPSVGRAGLFFSPYLFFRTFRGRRLAYGARFEESANDILEVLRTVDSHDDAVARMSANTNYIQCKFLSGNYAGALAYGRAAVETADRVGRTFEIAAQTWHGKAAVLEEEWDMAVEILEDCRRRAAEDTSGYRFSDSYLLSHLARAYAGRGDADARSAGEQAVSVARESGAVGFETEAQTAFARALLAIGSVDDAPLIESALARAEECATKAGWLAYLPMVAEERGRLARLRGDEAATDRAMREAHRVYSESGATGHAARLARELGV
jgi:tetratricopeptide (TPR) repeat protein